MSLQEVVQEYFRVVDARNFAELVNVFHPDVVYERPGYPKLIGLARLIQFYREERVLASGSHIIDGIVIQDMCGACWGRFVGNTHDGTPVDERFADVFTFEANRIKTRVTFFYKPAV